jgi:Cof subfamily protein (haloacid dehalogenase superfamily)
MNSENTTHPGTAQRAALDRPEHPIRMIALDLDETLLAHDKTVGPRTAEALREAARRGIEIVLASGRMTPAMERTAAELRIDCCIVAYNGAAVCGRAAQGRKRLVHRPLPAATARRLYEYARPRGYQVNYYLNDVIVSEDAAHLRPWAELYRSRTGSPYRFVPDLAVHLHLAPTKLLFVTAPEERPKIEADVRPMLGMDAAVIRTDPEYLEFLEPSVNKGWGVSELAGILGIPMHQVFAMGNGENDVEMLFQSGFGVAVANACAAAKHAARAVTVADHNHDAVAEALEKYVL